MPSDLQSARVYFSCLGGDEEREKAARRAPARGRVPAPRSRPALPAALRAGAPLHLRPLARARRPHRGAPPRGPSARPERRGRGLVTAPDPLRRGCLFLIDKPRGPDLARRRRARPRDDRRVAHRPQRDARSDGDRPPAPVRRRRGAPPGLLHAHGQVLRGHHPARPRDDDLRPRGRVRRSRTATSPA